MIFRFGTPTLNLLLMVVRVLFKSNASLNMCDRFRHSFDNSSADNAITGMLSFGIPAVQEFLPISRVSVGYLTCICRVSVGYLTGIGAYLYLNHLTLV